MKVMIDEVKSRVMCKFENLSLLSLTDNFNRRSKTTEQIPSYAQDYLQLHYESYTKQRDPNSFSGPENLISSLQRATDECKEASLIVLKSIRLSVADIKQLIPLFPNLKVIHLNRDPRGIFSSRWNFNGSRNVDQVKSHCQRWTNDLESVQKLSQLYNDQIRTVRYEKVAEDPQGTFRNIYRFIGIPYDMEINDYITNMTSASSDDCYFCIQRKNSTETASKWRQELNFKTAKFIYDSCKTANSRLGYLPFDSERELRDIDLPFYVDK